MNLRSAAHILKTVFLKTVCMRGERTFECALEMSALPLRPDIVGGGLDVR